MHAQAAVKWRRRGCVMASLLLAHAAVAGDAPRFADYPAQMVATHPAHAPDFTSQPLRSAPFAPDFHPPFTRFRTNLSTSLGEWVKMFAGHYRIVEWGCGTGCQESTIIDNATGRIYGYFSTNAGLDFRADSRLLIVNPGLDAAVADGYLSDQHTAYWLWNGHGFDPLRR